jgi:hypothetical protein
MSDTKQFKLEFSNRIIEHLGVKLYQNKPSNVIAEFISNAWDADAKLVDIDVKGGSDESPSIIITDNGRGMTRDELIDDFLVIGRNRRSFPAQKTSGGRLLMGRKGLGKLAGFGIAQTVDIITCPNSDLRKGVKKDNRNNTTNNNEIEKIYWLRFNLNKIIEQDKKTSGGAYEPEIIADGISLSDFQELPQTKDSKAEVASFENHVKQKQGGVCVRLFNTTLKKAINPSALLSSLGQRFTVTLLRHDFKVKVNGTVITSKKALPPFFNYAENGTFETPKEEEIFIAGKKRKIRYWVRFMNIKGTDFSIENAGIGIFTHEKIAQDRPFFFGVKGKEIYSRYVYGIIQADWLDELPDDVVSTDRCFINWETDETKDLYSWGEKNFPSWIESYRKWKEKQHKEEIKTEIRKRNEKLTAKEEEALSELLSDIFLELDSEEAKQKAVEKTTEAWTHEPMRRLAKEIWQKIFSGTTGNAQKLPELIDELNKSMVPESLSLAVTMAQRIWAITEMGKMIKEEKTETDLQRLIENNPWLIDATHSFLTANREIKTLVEEKHRPTSTTSNPLTQEQGKKRPDFVFLSDAGLKTQIVVYELKGPESEKTLHIDEYRQLVEYLDIIQDRYPQHEVIGLLVGHDKGGFKETDTRICVKRWAEIEQETRFLHIEYLAALLRVSNPDCDDVRMKQIAAFGGQGTLELLKKYENNNMFLLDKS